MNPLNSDEDPSTLDMMRLADRGGAFDFWLEEGECIYSIQGGLPIETDPQKPGP